MSHANSSVLSDIALPLLVCLGLTAGCSSAQTVGSVTWRMWRQPAPSAVADSTFQAAQRPSDSDQQVAVSDPRSAPSHRHFAPSGWHPAALPNVAKTSPAKPPMQSIRFEQAAATVEVEEPAEPDHAAAQNTDSGNGSVPLP